MGNAATQGKAHRASLATSTWSLSRVGTGPARKGGSLSRACPGRNWRGPGGLREPAGRARGGGEEEGEPQEPGPRGQQMRGRCEVPHRGGKAAAGAGRPCDVAVGGAAARGPEPGSSAERHLSGARGVVPGPARFDIHLPSPGFVSFRARKEGGDFRSQ